VFKGVHYEMQVAGESNLWLVHSTTMAPVGSRIGMSIKPDNIHLMKKVAQD
jgi:spermidine/putrescine transport system ATP-binding protein